MEDSKALLLKIEAEEKKNREVAAEIARKRNAVYQGLALEVIREVFKFRDDLKEVFKTFQGVNARLAELEAIFPGYLSFLQRSGSWETEFEPAQIEYIISYLLSGKWSASADFWRVLDQICDTISQKGNLFKEVCDG